MRAANLRIVAARVLFRSGQAIEARILLAEALREAIKAGLPDLARRIRKEMLEGDGAEHLDTMLKEKLSSKRSAANGRSSANLSGSSCSVKGAAARSIAPSICATGKRWR